MSASDIKAVGASGGDVESRGAAASVGERSRGWLWPAAAVLVVLVAGAVPLLFNHAFFWRGDTQVAYFGGYYRLGEALRAGDYPLLEPWAWRGGNHIVEGNTGLLSPIVMVFGLGATLISNAITYTTVWKVAFVAFAAGGNYLLARSYRLPQPAAAVVGILVPLCGFTMYLDAPTWFPGLMVSALLAYTWWGLRRTLLLGRNPITPLVFGMLLGTLGYVYGTVMLAFAILACIADVLLARDYKAVLKGLAIGALIAVPALVVRLPYVFSAAVTRKDSLGIHTNTKWAPTVTDLLTSMLPTNGNTAPLYYVGWLLPFLVFVNWRAARERGCDLVGIAGLWVVTLVLALGPGVIGPIRYTFRWMPYVTLTTILLGVILFSRARYRRLSVNRLLLALAIVVMCGYVTASQHLVFWRIQAVAALLVCFGLLVVWLLIRDGRPASSWRAGRAAAGFIAIWSVVLVGAQHHYVPETFAGDRGMPGPISEYKAQMTGAVGDTFVVGHARPYVTPETQDEPLVLIANSWYVSDRRVQNVHGNTSFLTYAKRYCFSAVGSTCNGALHVVFSTEPTTGMERVDLLSVSSVALLKRTIPERTMLAPPPGWHIGENSDAAVIWVRDQPLPTAGGVVWTTPGLEVTEEFRDDESVRLRVAAVPAGGGEIVLSRLDWPGYRIHGATAVDPVDDYLLTLKVTPDASGQEVSLRYEPPHWHAMLGLLAFACLAGLIWSLGEAIRSRRRRSERTVPGRLSGT